MNVNIFSNPLYFKRDLKVNPSIPIFHFFKICLPDGWNLFQVNISDMRSEIKLNCQQNWQQQQQQQQQNNEMD